MNLFQRRQLKKQIKHVLHDARHARHMREDIVDAGKIEAIREAEADVRAAWSEGDYAAVERHAEELIRRTRVIYPVKSYPRVREYVEILVVAISVAMAFRTFFVQPFKIPTGSMEPTLYGIQVVPQDGRGAMDRFPLSLVSLALFGDRYVEVRARRSGVITQLLEDDTRTFIYSSDGIVPPIRRGMMRHFREGDFVQQGEVLASGRVRAGDHIFVNKMRYNFRPPRRGDVFVFSTHGVTHPQVKPDTFYIKRMVGMPGETVRIDEPYLVIDGQRVLEPDVFRRQVEDSHLGYSGFVLAPPALNTPTILSHPRAELPLGPTQYLPLGDNSHHSLDGRYFGGVDRENIVGPAIVVYWPISSRWGWIR